MLKIANDNREPTIAGDGIGPHWSPMPWCPQELTLIDINGGKMGINEYELYGENSKHHSVLTKYTDA